MGPLRIMEGGKPDGGVGGGKFIGDRGMGVSNIGGDEEGAVRIDGQYRPRSWIRRSAPGKTRSPKIFLRRAAKSGYWTVDFSTCSGTMCAMTRSRSRSSTVFPPRSQFFRRRASRSWRMLSENLVIKYPKMF